MATSHNAWVESSQRFFDCRIQFDESGRSFQDFQLGRRYPYDFVRGAVHGGNFGRIPGNGQNWDSLKTGALVLLCKISAKSVNNLQVRAPFIFLTILSILS